MRGTAGTGALLALVVAVGCQGSGSSRSGGKTPAQVLGVVAAAGDGQVTISWQPALKADTHDIYFSTSPGVTPATGTPIPGVTSPFTHTGLANGQAYHYVVVGVKGSRSGPPSAEAAATPFPAPTGLFAAPASGQLTLTWNPVPGATSYNLYWDTTFGVTPQTGTRIAGVISGYVHTGLVNETTYWYVVTAVTPTGDGAPSLEASATPRSSTASVWIDGVPFTFLSAEHYYDAVNDISGIWIIGSVPLGWTIDIWWFGDVDPGCGVDSCTYPLQVDVRTASGANYWENPCIEDMILCTSGWATAPGGTTTGTFSGQMRNIAPPGDVITLTSGQFTAVRR